MASDLLTKEEQNFIRFVKARDDVMPLPLRDILDWQIKPKYLNSAIQSCPALISGEHSLDSYQTSLTKQKDYSNFDVSLLYKLLRNLCPVLKPTQRWGIKPKVSDTSTGDDIERMRFFRNEFGHSKSASIPDGEFKTRWTDLKFVVERLQKAMSKYGYIADYKEKLKSIEELDFGDEPREKYKTFLVLEYAYNQLQQANDRGKLEVSISGKETVLCGDTAIFKAEVTTEDPSSWSLTWQKTRKHVTKSINISKEKYSESTDRKLVITSVSKKDEWRYQAVLSRNSNGNKQKILSNEILLQVLGELPRFDDWKVTSDIDGISIHYAIEDKPPTVFTIAWTKNDELLNVEYTNYVGGSLEDKFLKITSPTVADGAKYCCTITNAVGSASMDVTFDVPKAKLSTVSQCYYGSSTSIWSEVVSCPAADRVQWQKSIDRLAFYCIDISEAKYHGSSLNPESPKLEINCVSFDDKQHYRLRVWNKIGVHASNTVFLNVIGGPPNVTICHETSFKNRSVTLIGMVFLPEQRPEIETIFWSKNGQKLNSNGMRNKYSEVNIKDPSLTIFEVNKHDAGSYQLTATNALGSTQSDAIVLGIPVVYLENREEKDDSWWFTMSIKSIPSPCTVQWSIKEKNSDSFKIIDTNAEEFRETSNSLSGPVLVIKQCEKLQTHLFQIEVQNFIGSCKKTIHGDTNPETPYADTNKSRGLSKLYNDKGRSVTFANLFDELAEKFPIDKMRRLQDLIENSGKVADTISLKNAKCARDCLRILRDENLFSPEDVIFIQYLLKKTNCKELNTRCYEYAKAQKALCFYEMPSENGFKKVKFHVQADIKQYTKKEIEIIRNTVVELLICKTKDIFVSGFDHSSSFYVIVSIREDYIKNMFALEEHDEQKLAALRINCFMVDCVTVYLNDQKENGFKQVVFCVQRHRVISFQRQINLIEQTVAVLLGCTANIISVRKSNYNISYIDVVVSIKQRYLRNLIRLEEHDKKKLIGVNIDCFIADSLTVFLNPTKELEEKLAETQIMSESTFKESFLDGKYGKPKMPAPTPNKVQRLNKVHTSFELMKLFSKRHSMRESIFKGSIIDDKYGPNITSPFPNELQELQEADTLFDLEENIPQSMYDNISTESFLDDKYGPNISLSASNELQKLKEADSSLRRTERLAATQGMQERIFKESVAEDKYVRPKIPLPDPLILQRLKEPETIFGRTERLAATQSMQESLFKESFQEKKYAQSKLPLPNPYPWQRLKKRETSFELEENIPQSMYDNIPTESFLDDKYGPNISSPASNELQKLKEADSSLRHTERLAATQGTQESIFKESIAEDKYVRPTIPLPDPLILQRLKEPETIFGRTERLAATQSKQESHFKESFQEEKYAQSKIPLSNPHPWQRLKKRETSFGQGRTELLSATQSMQESFFKESFQEDKHVQPKIPDPLLLQRLEPTLFETTESFLHPRQETVIHTRRITLPLRSNLHISCLRSDKFWVSGVDEIIEMNDIGNMLKKIDVKGSSGGHHTLTKEGELLFLNENRVYKLALQGDLCVFCMPFTISYCVHSSKIDGDVLVGSKYGVIRYKDTGDLLQIIPLENKEDTTDEISMYITENINRDVIVSCRFMKKVVAVGKAGRHRFEYRGHRPYLNFLPMGICTDVLGHILVNSNGHVSNVQLLDINGHFLSVLLTHTYEIGSGALSVDDKHSLYVGSFGRIDVYRYLTDAMLEKGRRSFCYGSQIARFNTVAE